MFGLINPLALFQFLEEPEENGEPDASVSALRRVAAQCQFHKDDCVIAYRPRTSALVDLGVRNPAEIHRVYEMNMEYTTIIPQARKSHKRNRNGESLQTLDHTGWLQIDSTVDPTNQRFVDYLEKGNEEIREQLDMSTFFDSSRDCGGLAIASDLRCRCHGSCDSTCSCKRNRQRCTSLC